jgi:hypothetical protein
MSILKKNTLTLAIIAAAGFATSASAYVIGTRATGAAANSAVDQTAVRVATSEIAGAATIVESGEDIAIQVNADSLILGRTTGMTLRLDLTNGAQFSQNLNLSAPAAVGDEVRIGSALPSGWTASISAGGTVGSTFVIFNFNPPTVVSPNPVPGLLQGDIIVIEGGVFAVPVAATDGTGVSLRNLQALQSPNATVGITSQFRDPNTALPIMSALTTPILTSGNPIQQSCDQTGRAEPNERIDVGSIAQPAGAGQGPRVGFSSDGSIGTVVNNGTRNYIFNAGRVVNAIDSSFSTFTYADTDSFTFALTLADGGFGTGGAFNAANSLFLAADAACTTAVTSTVVSTVGNTRTLSYTGLAAETALGAAADQIDAGFNLFVCLQVPTTNTTVINPSAITGTSTHARGTAVTPAHAACTLAPLQTNGSVVNIANLPPAGNATQEGFIRIVNNSTTSGTVTIRGKDDAGANGANAVTLSLPAGRSVVYTSAELESGTLVQPAPPAVQKPTITGSLGNGDGRWRLNIVGEFDNMQVQAYARNVNNDALSNITDFESNQEQAGERKNLNFD